jgi:penicillin-binding protein 1A
MVTPEEKNMKETTKKKIVRWFWLLFTAPIVLVFALVGLVWAFADIPSFEELENPDSKLATQVISEEGEILTTFHIDFRFFNITRKRIDIYFGVLYTENGFL